MNTISLGRKVETGREVVRGPLGPGTHGPLKVPCIEPQAMMAQRRPLLCRQRFYLAHRQRITKGLSEYAVSKTVFLGPQT